MAITKNWEIKKMGDVCQFIGGGTPSKANKSFWNGNVPWASIKDIKGDILHETQDFISEEGLKNSASNLANENELIIATRINPGRPIITRIKTAINQDLKVARPKLNVETKFLFYTFKNIENKILKLSSGTTVLGIRLEILNSIPIPIPDLATQHAIVAKIEELFSALDKSVSELKTIQEQLKVYRQSVLKWAFEGRFGFGNRAPEDVKDGELPEGWSWKSLGEIFKVSSGKGIKINQLRGGKYAVYGGNGLNGFHTEYFIEEPVLIIGRVGVKCGVTHITKSKSWVSDNALIVRPISIDFDMNFFKLKLEYENLNKLSVSTAQPVISGNSIYNLFVHVPPLPEQHHIVSEIERRLSVSDEMERCISESLAQAEQLRQSILKKAFSGELV